MSRSLRMRLHRTLDIIHMPALFDLILGSEDAVDPTTDRKNHARAAHIFNIDPLACVVATAVNAMACCSHVSTRRPSGAPGSTSQPLYETTWSGAVKN